MTAISHRRLWRAAGWLMIGHVVLVLAGSSLARAPMLGDKPEVVARDLVAGSMTGAFAGGYVECLGFLVFLVGATLLARLLRGNSETSGWLADCVSASAVVYVVLTVASGLAPGAAAIYDAHHGAPLATVTTVNDVRNFAFFLSGAVAGVFALSVASAARVTGVLPRWVSYSGWVIGVASIATVPGAGAGAMVPSTLLWFVWLVALGVTALRTPERPAADAGRGLDRDLRLSTLT